MSHRNITLEAMRQEVFDAKPGLANIINENRAKSLMAYRYQPNSDRVSGLRKNELLETVRSLATRLFGGVIADTINKQLSEQWYVSTAEHHGPVSHPFVVGGTFVASLMNQRQGRNTAIIFSTSNVSLNNSSFPRGFVFHTPALAEVRLSLQPGKYRQNPVASLPKIKSDAYADLVVQIRKYNSNLGEKFIQWQEKLMEVDTYVEQVSILNELFWRCLPGQENMHLIYLSQEAIVSSLLTKYHLEKNTELHELIFNNSWRLSYKCFFNGLVGAFSDDGRRGTFLFWAIRDGHRFGLSLEGDELVSIDRSYRLRLLPETIATALKNGELLPSMALTFIVLSCYYGLLCGGGFSQVDYLPKIQIAYQAMLNDLGVSIANEKTEIPFLSSDYAFISLQTGDKQVLATGLDLALYGNDETFNRLTSLAETTTVSQALDNLIPKLYTIVGGKKNVFPFINAAMPSCLYV